NNCTPFITDLQSQCSRPVTLYGAYGSAWVPLYGPHAGETLLAPEPFINGQNRDSYRIGPERFRKGAFDNFISKDEELAENARLTDLYYEHARCTPETALAINDSSQNNRSRFWYRT